MFWLALFHKDTIYNCFILFSCWVMSKELPYFARNKYWADSSKNTFLLQGSEFKKKKNWFLQALIVLLVLLKIYIDNLKSFLVEVCMYRNMYVYEYVRKKLHRLIKKKKLKKSNFTYKNSTSWIDLFLLYM